MNTEALIRSSRRTVLVVEDEVINREMLGFILQDQYDVLFAGNGQEALEQLRAFDGTVAMILLDINMPVMNGYELMDALRALWSRTTATTAMQVTRTIAAMIITNQLILYLRSAVRDGIVCYFRTAFRDKPCYLFLTKI